MIDTISCENCDYKETCSFSNIDEVKVCASWEPNNKQTPADIVNHPPHYESGKFECIDVMRETQGDEAVQNFCICNAQKYIYRHRNKNGVEDIRKAKWYIDKYLEIEEEKNESKRY